jgi:glutamate dehydrogenase
MPLYLNGQITAKEYAYCGAVSMFVYYFLSHRNEDLDYLRAALKGDQEKLTHLENIRKSLRQETVSLPRITQTMATYPNLIRDLVSVFEEKFGNRKDSNVGWQEKLVELKERIAKVAESDQDREILDHMVTHINSCVKTNFFKLPKTALSFRIDPHLLKFERAFPDVPYGIFMFVGNDFHGFHVRFNDIARGGLRLVISRDKITFSRNLETAFLENYNLAHTQNRKNKGSFFIFPFSIHNFNSHL